MNTAELEQAVADFTADFLESIDLGTVPVKCGNDGGELEPFETSIIIICDQSEHAAGPLWTATLRAVVTTPALTGEIETHRDIAREVAHAFSKDAADHYADLAEAVYGAGFCLAGTFATNAEAAREAGRWVNAIVVTFGLVETESEAPGGPGWKKPTFAFDVEEDGTGSAEVSVKPGIWFFVARLTVTDESGLTLGVKLSGIVKNAAGTVTLPGAQKMLLIGENATFGAVEATSTGGFLAVNVAAAGDALTVGGSVSFYGSNLSL